MFHRECTNVREELGGLMITGCLRKEREREGKSWAGWCDGHELLSVGKMTLLSIGEIPTQQEQVEEGVTQFFCFFLNIFLYSWQNFQWELGRFLSVFSSKVARKTRSRSWQVDPVSVHLKIRGCCAGAVQLCLWELLKLEQCLKVESDFLILLCSQVDCFSFSSMKDAVKTLSSIWVKYFVPVWKAQDFQPDFWCVWKMFRHANVCVCALGVFHLLLLFL